MSGLSLTIAFGTPMAENTQPKQPHQSEGSVPEAWRRTELARHPQRPYPMDYIQTIFTDFSEIHGDRQFADDSAMTAGMARFHGEPVLVVGNLKGRSLKATAKRCVQCESPRSSGILCSRLLTWQARTPAWAPKSAGRVRPSPATY